MDAALLKIYFIFLELQNSLICLQKTTTDLYCVPYK